MVVTFGMCLRSFHRGTFHILVNNNVAISHSDASIHDKDELLRSQLALHAS
jgi:hypothetical protein